MPSISDPGNRREFLASALTVLTAVSLPSFGGGAAARQADVSPLQRPPGAVAAGREAAELVIQQGGAADPRELRAQGGATDQQAPANLQEMRGQQPAAGQQAVVGQGAPAGQGAPTIRQVIDALLADVPGAPFPNTVDTIKAGDPGVLVKGIVTTMFATDAVIQRTIDLGANFIIAHEPTFYNHLDETDWLDKDPVLTFKRDLLDKHGIVVWRFHDGLHAHKPDGVRMGVLNALGWESYYTAGDPPLITLPDTPLGAIISHVKKKLGIDKLKFIGDPSQVCRRIVLSPGAAGGRSQIAAIRKYNPDVFICGELNEWETSEYIRDARYQGLNSALIVLGHSVSEEPGLQWLLPVLQQKFPGVRATHVVSGDAFSWA